jgi:hypothetical protein
MKHQILSATLVVFMGLGLALGAKQDKSDGASAKDPKVVEYKGLKVSVADPKPEDKKPLEAAITVENPGSTSCKMKIPVVIRTQDANPMSRVPVFVPKVALKKDIEVCVDAGKKVTQTIRILDSWDAGKNRWTTYTIAIADDKGEPVLGLLRYTKSEDIK